MLEVDQLPSLTQNLFISIHASLKEIQEKHIQPNLTITYQINLFRNANY